MALHTMREQKKMGVAIQYLNLIINMATGIFFTPFLIKSLGSAEYGFYRIIQSFAGQLGIMTFGICTLVTRNVVKYNTLEQKKEKENFLAMAGIISIILAIATIGVGFILSLSMDTLFDKSLTSGELVLAKKLFWLLILNVSVTILNDMVTGIINAHERFIIKYGMITLRYILRIVILIVLLTLKFKSLAIVLTDLSLTILLFLINIVYSFGILKEKIKFYYLDVQELKISFVFSFAILLQAIVNQVNQNLDNIILGAMTNTETVTIYSIALTLFTMFNSITLVIGSVYIPQATRMIMHHASGEELTDLVIKPGRLQFMVGSLIVTGYILFGKKFIYYWVGEEYYGAYIVGIILMIPALIPLVQNVTGAILDAMLKRLGRSLILICMAGINLIVSIICVHFWGYIGASFGTAFSYIIGSGILMNIYLYRVTDLNLKRMYMELIPKSLLVAIGSMMLFAPIVYIGPDTLYMLLIKILAYVTVFGGGMYFFSMRDYEKKLFLDTVQKLYKREIR